MNIDLGARDWRWNCNRTFSMQLADGEIDFFFIDTNPFVLKYYSTNWANFTGARPVLQAMHASPCDCA